MCVWATWCLPLVFAYHLPTACLGRGSCKVSALQLRTSGCWGAPNWHSALVQHAARRWACIPQSTYSTRMRQSIALWSLAWISLKVVLYSVSQLSYLSESIQFNSNTTLHLVSGVNFDSCVFLVIAGVGWWPLVSLDCAPVGVRLWIQRCNTTPAFLSL